MMSSVVKKVAHEPQNHEIPHCRKDANKIEKSVELIKHYLKNVIIHGDIELNENIANESMALLYLKVIEDINSVLEVKYGNNCIQGVYNSKTDASPDETADRIVSSSIAFFSNYLQQQSKKTDVQAAGSFVDLIAVSIDKGFVEARNILDELKILEGDIERNIDATYDFVQVGLQSFEYGFVRNAKSRK